MATKKPKSTGKQKSGTKASPPAMTPQQQALWSAMTHIQKTVAPYLLAGKQYAEAYRLARPDQAARMKKSTLTNTAWQIANNKNVVAWLEAMREQIISNAIMTREEALERLSIIARANLNDLIDFGEYRLGEENGQPIIQSTWRIKPQAQMTPEAIATISEITSGKEGIKIKQHSALAALKQLSEMMGWDAPVKVQPLEPKSLDDFYNDVDEADETGADT